MKKRPYIIGASLVLIVVGAIRAFAEQSEIRLRSAAVLPAGSVYLADIADIKAESTQQQDQLKKLVVAELPRDMKNFSVGYLEIARALGQIDICPAQVDIYGASYCRLTCGQKKQAESVISKVKSNEKPSTIDQPPTDEKLINPTPAFTLADQLSQLVAQMSGLEQTNLKIQWRCGDPDFLEEAADHERFKIEPRSTITLGDVRFEVTDNQADAEGTPPGRPAVVRVRGTVELVCESLAVTRAMAPGEVITEADVKLVTRRVSSFREIGLTEIAQVVGQEVARPLAPDTVIQSAMIRKLMLVKRNQKVGIHSRVGPVQIDAQGVALESGAYGDVIRVRFDNQSRTVIRGRIAGPGVVIVTEAESAGAGKLAEAGSRSRNDFITGASGEWK